MFFLFFHHNTYLSPIYYYRQAFITDNFRNIIIPMGLNSIQNNAILIKRRVPTPKWMLLVGFQVLTNLRLFCVQTGEAILFLLIPLIEKDLLY